MAEDYVYAVTRVHINEQNLLSAQDLEQLISADSVAGAFRILADKGWGSPDLPEQDADALVHFETKRTWALISELLDDMSPFDVFLIANDYHNLKAAIKLAYTANIDGDNEGYYLQYGTVPVEIIIPAASSHDFSHLPEGMAAAGRAAYEVLARTGSGQLCDMAIDRACLVAVDKAGKVAESKLLRRYAELTVDVANIKAAVRCSRMGKSADFIEQAIAPAGTLNTSGLIAAAASGQQAVINLLGSTAYDGAIEALESSMSSFERWCDNQMIAMIKPQKNNYFSIEPMAAYILGRQNEIQMVRLILSAKINNLSSKALRERLRDTYV